MDRMQHILLSLLRAGLWGKVPSIEGFPLTAEEWKLLFFESMKQTIQGVVYDAILQLPNNVYPPEDLLIKWRYAVREIEEKYLRHLKLISYLSVRYEQEAGLTPVILKGLAMASYYLHPNHRVVGDIDLFFGGTENSEKINLLMERWGINVLRGESNESISMMNNVTIENHGTFITSHNHFVTRQTKAVLAEQIATQTAYKVIELENTNIKTLAPLHNHLLLLTHSLKHVLNEGIGFRQLCDIAVLLRAEKTQVDAETLRQVLKDWGIYKWACLLYAFCERYLGISLEELPFTFDVDCYSPEVLFREVWKSGNFGHMDKRMIRRSPEGDSFFTAKRIYASAWRFLKYAPGDAIGLPWDYTIGYIEKKLKANKKEEKYDKSI